MSPRLSSLLAVAVAATLGAGTARADSGRVVTGHFPVEQHIEVFEPESSACGFPIRADLAGRGTFQVFFDAGGEPTGANILIHASGTLSANGVEIRFGVSDNAFLDVDGSKTEVGLVFRYARPGLGVVLMDRGRLIFDIAGQVHFEAGPHPLLHGDFGELCAAFGG